MTLDPLGRQDSLCCREAWGGGVRLQPEAGGWMGTQLSRRKTQSSEVKFPGFIKSKNQYSRHGGPARNI